MSHSDDMQAIAISADGLVPVQKPVPEIAGDQILVKVKFAALKFFRYFTNPRLSRCIDIATVFRIVAVVSSQWFWQRVEC